MTTHGRMVNFTKPMPDFHRKFYDLYIQKSMVDVTLSAEGQFLYAHKAVLCCASSWFEELFTTLPRDKEPVIVLKDISFALLHNILDFIYLGTTDIHEYEISNFKNSLDSLRISLDGDESIEKGLEELNENHEDSEEEQFEAVKENWDEVTIKEERKERQTVIEKFQKPRKLLSEPPKPVLGSLTSRINFSSSIQFRPALSTPKILRIKPLIPKNSPQSPSPVIRIETPSRINEKVKTNEPTKTLKLVPKLPTLARANSRQTAPQIQKVQELTKQLKKAILVRRVKKTDGSFVSERVPIKIQSGIVQKVTTPPRLATSPALSTKQTFHCSHCSKAFSFGTRKNAHEKFCFKNPNRPSTRCPYCPMVLSNSMSLAKHIKNIHGLDENGKSIVDNENLK